MKIFKRKRSGLGTDHRQREYRPLPAPPIKFPSMETKLEMILIHGDDIRGTLRLKPAALDRIYRIMQNFSWVDEALR